MEEGLGLIGGDWMWRCRCRDGVGRERNERGEGKKGEGFA